MYLILLVERFQLNDLTAYVDASNVYGSTNILANALRSYKDGLLKSSVSLVGFTDNC